MADETHIAQENYERFVYARDNGHTDFVRKADQCDNFYQGAQWDPAIRDQLRRQGKPALTINKIISTITSVQGELLNNRADVTFLPAERGDDETAHALSRTYLHIAQRNDFHWLEQDVADDGFITSRGFYDVRVEFDENLYGHIVLRQLNPRNVAVDPDAERYDPDDWKEVFVTKWLSAQDIELLYGKAKAEKLKHRQFSDFLYGYDSIDRPPQNFGNMATLRYTGGGAGQDPEIRRHIRVIERQYWRTRRVRSFVDPETGDMRSIPENWDEDHIQQIASQFNLEIVSRNYRSIRWTVSADNVLLHDDWSPYKHFTVVPYFPYFRRGKTIGLVESLLGSQEQLNKLSSQELHIVNTTANSGWKVKRNTLTNMTVQELEERGAETGIVIEWDDDNGAGPEKIQPNQVPTGLDRISAKADAWIKEISGISDSMRGFDREDVAARAIQAKQQRGSVNLAKPFDNLRRTRVLLARRVLALIQAYYTEPRVLRITGDRPGEEVEELEVNMPTPEGRVVNDLTVGTYDVVIATRPPRENYDEDQFNELLNLRQNLGVPVPDHFLIELSGIENKAEIIRELRMQSGVDSAEQQAEQAQAQAQLEAQKNQAETRRATADAMLAEARARKVLAETAGQIPNEEAQMEAQRRQQELELKRLEMQHQAQMERARLEFEREKAREELRLKEAIESERLEIMRQKEQDNGQQGAQ